MIRQLADRRAHSAALAHAGASAQTGALAQDTVPVRAINGFTLIEAMVAMTILAVATVGIIRAGEAHVDLLRGLERRASAQWVAENALAEAGAGMAGSAPGWHSETMTGWRWQLRIVQQPSADADLRQLIVEVRAPDETTPTISLRGFGDAGIPPP